MKILTLFKAYQKAESIKQRNAELRGGVFGGGFFGIATGTDERARRWQRYDRLSQRIEARFNGEKVCPICVARNSNHYTYCRYYQSD